MASHSFSISSIFFCCCFVFFFFFMVSPSSADMALIQKLCTESSIHIDFCITTLSTDKVSLNCTTMECVTAVAVNHAYRNCTDVIIYANNLLMTENPPKEIATQISYCVDLYRTTKFPIEKAIESLNSKDYGAAWEYLSVHYYEDCEPGFAAHPSPLAEANEKFGEMLDVAWELVDRFVDVPPGGRRAGPSRGRGRRH